MILIHNIFPGIGETEGETSVDETTKISCETKITEGRSKYIHQATAGKHALNESSLSMKESLFTYLYICLGPKNTKGGLKRDHSAIQSRS